MIEIKVNGVIYNGFTSVSVTKSIDDFCGQFTIEASVKTQIFPSYPVRKGMSVEILVDDVTWMTAIVERIVPKYDSENMNITIEGRDKTCDIIDSTAGSNMSIEGPITLKALIEQSLSLNNINGIKVIDRVGDLKELEASEIIRPDFGYPLFQYLESYAQKCQALLITNAEGNIEITRTDNAEKGVKFRNVIGDENNIVKGRLLLDDSERYYKYFVSSQANFTELRWLEDPIQEAVAQGGTAYDTAIRTSRILNIIAHTPLTNEECQQRATWEANVRRARAITYDCEINGHSMEDGSPYYINQLHSVQDDFAGITSEMIAKAVHLESNDKGNFGTITMVPPDAYKVESVPTKKQKNSSSIGLVWDDTNFDKTPEE